MHAFDVGATTPGAAGRSSRPLLEGDLRARTGARPRRRAGCGAYCAELRRDGERPPRRRSRRALDDVARDPLGGTWRISCADALAHLPARELDSGEREALLQGRAIAAAGEQGPLRCLSEGRLVAVAEARGAELRSLVAVDEP